MSGPEALAITAVIMIVPAIVCGAALAEAPWYNEKRWMVAALTSLGVAMACGIGAAWWAVIAG